MMKKISLFLIFYFLFCCEKPLPKPDDLIDQDDFVEIMTESYLYRNLSAANIREGQIDYSEQMGYVLQNKDLDWETFKESYAYYMMNESTNKKITKEVRNRLEMMVPDEENKEIKEKSIELNEKIKSSLPKDSSEE